MIAGIRTGDIIFLDIETAPSTGSYEKLPENIQLLWDTKSKFFREDDETASQVWDRAAIYSEFGKIICISVGIITGVNPHKLRLKSFFGDDEKQLLSEFSAMLARFKPENEINLCAHNGKEFDFPYIGRRMIINRLPIPQILNNTGKKPWEVKLLDTMEMWKFGDYKHFTSLELLTAILGISSPKDDLDGSMVARTYWENHDVKRIVTYCEKDVIAVARVYLAMTGDSLIDDSDIESVTFFPKA